MFSRRITGLSAMYWNNFLRNLAMSLAGLYVPLYIYNIFERLEVVLIFYLIIWISELIVVFPILKFVARKGYRVSIFYANVLHASFYLILLFIPEYNQLLYIAAVVRSFITPLVWLPIHSLFIEDDNDDEIGKEVSLRHIYQKLGAAIAPFLGGVIITQFGFNILYALAIAVILASSIPLFVMPRHKRQEIPGAGGLLKTFFSKRFRRYMIGYFGQAFDGQIFSVVWIIYLFLIIGSFEVYGAVRSVVTLISSFTTYVAGKLADKFGHRKLLKVGVLTNASMWFIRPFVRTLGFGFFVESLDSIQSPLYKVPLMSAIYDRSEKSMKKPLEFFFERELALTVGRVLVFSLSLVLIRMGLSMQNLFVLTGFATFLVFLLAKKPRQVD